MNQHKYTSQVKIVLQGREEPFYEYEARVNEILRNLKVDCGHALVFPSASSSGRICSIINYELFLSVPIRSKIKLPGYMHFEKDAGGTTDRTVLPKKQRVRWKVRKK